MTNTNGQSANESTKPVFEPVVQSHRGVASDRRGLLRIIEQLLHDIRASIVQVVGDLARENRSFRDQELERHFVDPLVRGFLATLRRWNEDMAVSDAEARRATSKAVSDVWKQRREDREADIGELEEEVARLGYTAFVDPVGTTFDSRRHEPREQIIAAKRRRIGLVSKALRPGCLRPNGSILEKQWVGVWVASDVK